MLVPRPRAEIARHGLAGPAGGLAETVEAETRAVQGPRHAVELQSVRGVAAMVVVLFHATHTIFVPGAPLATANLLFNAPAAVLSFFVLSGYVLARSQLARPRSASEAGLFYLRRLFRIYPALWAATAFALLYRAASAYGHAAGLPTVDAPYGAGFVDPRLLIETLFGKATELALPVWTLWVELVGSALMPVLVLLLARSPWLLAPCLLLLAIAGSVPALNVQGLPLLMTGFVYGAALVAVVPWLATWLRSDSAARLLGAASLALLWFGRNRFGLAADQPYGPEGVLVSGLGAALLIGAIAARPAAWGLLRRPAMAWLGDVSYSLYLLHMPVIGLAGLALAALAAPVMTAYPIAATVVLMVLGAGLGSLLATASYRHVELPGIRLGKRAVAALRPSESG